MKVLTQNSPQKRLKLLRIDREVEQQVLAEATGLSLSLIEKIEAGDRKPTRRTAARLEAFFGQRIFATPSEYRRRTQRAPASRRACTSRAFTFPCGTSIEFVDNSDAAIELASERPDAVTQDGCTVTFTRPVTFRIPRGKDSAPAATIDPSGVAAPPMPST